MAASVNKPAVNPPVASRIHPIRYGPTNPPILPIEFTSAIPPAAAVPRSIAVGIAQNGPSVPQMPNAAIDNVASATAGVAGASAVITKPAAPIRHEPATCQRRSRLRSDRAPTTTSPIVAATYGIAVSSTIVADPSVLIDCTSCGSQNAMP